MNSWDSFQPFIQNSLAESPELSSLNCLIKYSVNFLLGLVLANFNRY